MSYSDEQNKKKKKEQESRDSNGYQYSDVQKDRYKKMQEGATRGPEWFEKLKKKFK